MQSDVKYFPLTNSQSSIWYLEKLNPGTGIGNIAATLKIESAFDNEVMNQVLNSLIQRNEGMRLRFCEQDHVPMQYVADYRPIRFDIIDFSDRSQAELFAWDQTQNNIAFELIDSEMFYFAFVRRDPDFYGVYIRINHLISDAWSLVYLANEIMSCYHLLKNGQDAPTENAPSYLEFIESEKDYLLSNRFAGDQIYWQEKFSNPPELTSLKISSTRRIGLHARRKSFVLPDKLTNALRSYCAENRTSIFSLFFAALCLYISRVKDVHDVTIGTPVLNRVNAREKKTIGMFISTVPLRVQVNGNDSFADFSKSIEKEWFSVLKHQKYPFDFLVRHIRETHKSVEKLFDIAISYQNAKMVEDHTGIEHEARWHFNEYQVESLYIHINDRETDGKIVMNYDFLSDLFYVKEIEFIHDHLIRLLWHALNNPARELSRIEMVSENEKQKIISKFNQSQATFPEDETISRLFEKQAAQQPDAAALAFGSETLTYGQLNRRANRLAQILRAKGVGPETIVALYLPRSIEMIVAILGVVKSGGAYLPIDPDYPAERASYMLQDSRAPILLTGRDLTANLDFSGDVIDVFTLAEQNTIQDEDENLPDTSQPNDLLYVIYTSGSTGMPKGVMIEHRNVVQLLFNSQFQFDFDSKDVWTMFHSYCFDFSVWEMYGALLKGGKLVIIDKEVARNTEEFLSVLKRERVTILNQTPAAFYNLIDTELKCSDRALSLRTVIFGGDALKPVLLKPFRKVYPDTRLINMYGITETTVHVTFYELHNEDLDKNISNIGKPLPLTQTYILDRNLNPQPIGTPGEICVGGCGVGRGYLNNEILTATRFVPNPFVPGTVLYRSGDMGRFFSQGDIEYLGRIDNQVKIRGHRIELGEIESGILKFDRIKEVTVQTRETSSGSRQICAYLVAREQFEIQALRAFLESFLPEYMVPSHFVKIDKIPLTGNGKIDRDKLPQPDQTVESIDNFVAPEDELQASIVKIWQDILEISRIGINDNFFRLGGDSLSAMVVVTAIGHQTTFADLYNNPTAKSLAAAIQQKTDQTKPRLLVKLSNNADPAARSIICFPYGGGNGVVFMDLADSLRRQGSQICVYTIDLPGRDLTCATELLSNQEIAQQLTKEIRSTIKGELILYGHCVGSALALATARLLQHELVPIRAIYLGAILPPKNVLKMGRNYDPWRLVSDRLIVRFLSTIGLAKLRIPKDYLKVMIKAFRHDVQNYYQFFYDLESETFNKARMPIHSIVGSEDLMTLNYKQKNHLWARYAMPGNLFVIQNSKHYFIKSHADQLAAILAKEGCQEG